ncbi:MAG: hypothetical protein ACON4U_05710 [Myxococcota bacterium]
MTAIIGYFHRDFQTSFPRKLCRRRERWIESPPVDSPSPLIHRLVISAAIRKEGLKRPLYGLQEANVSIESLIWSLFENEKICAWTEETPSSLTPIDASGVEYFEVSRPGVPLRTWFSRWELDCARPTDINRAIQLGSDVFVINPKERPEGETVFPAMPIETPYEGPEIVFKDPIFPEKLREGLFFLTGHREGGDSMERYLPAAIDDILEQAEAVVLFHADRDSDCLAIYAKTELLDSIEKLKQFAEAEDFPISEFEVPPMVARWDRVWRAHQHNTDDDEDSSEDSEGDTATAISQESKVGVDSDTVQVSDDESVFVESESSDTVQVSDDESVFVESDSSDEASTEAPEI